MSDPNANLMCLQTARWKTRGRGPGVRGPGVWKTRGLVENEGSGGKRRSGGKRGVWWKTRGLSGKHGGNVFSPKYEFSSLK